MYPARLGRLIAEAERTLTLSTFAYMRERHPAVGVNHERHSVRIAIDPADAEREPNTN